MDVFLPHLDGLDAVISLKASSDTADIPVILVSAQVGVADRVRALNLGAVDYLAKPFHASELLQRAERALSVNRRTTRGRRRARGAHVRGGGRGDRAPRPARASWPGSRRRRRGPDGTAGRSRSRWPAPTRCTRICSGPRPPGCASACASRTCSPTSGQGTFAALLPECTSEQAMAVFGRVESDLRASTSLTCTVEVAEVPGRELPEAVLEHLLEGRPVDADVSAPGWQAPLRAPLLGFGPGNSCPWSPRSSPRSSSSAASPARPRVDVSAMKEAMEAPSDDYSSASAYAHFLRARLLALQGEHARSVEQLRLALASDPGRSELRARARRGPGPGRGCPARPRPPCAGCWSARPDHVPALLFLGRLLFETDRPQRAREVLERVRRLAPREQEPYLLLAEMSLEAGHPEEAVRTVQALAELNRDTTGLKRLGLALLDRGEPETARGLLRAHRADRPGRRRGPGRSGRGARGAGPLRGRRGRLRPGARARPGRPRRAAARRPARAQVGLGAEGARLPGPARLAGRRAGAVPAHRARPGSGPASRRRPSGCWSRRGRAATTRASCSRSAWCRGRWAAGRRPRAPTARSRSAPRRGRTRSCSGGWRWPAPGKPAAAEQATARGAAHAPGDVALEAGHAAVLEAIGAPGRAEQFLQARIRASGSTELVTALAQIFSRTGAHAEAVSVLTEALKAHPRDEELLYTLGTVLERSGATGEAHRPDAPAPGGEPAQRRRAELHRLHPGRPRRAAGRGRAAGAARPVHPSRQRRLPRLARLGAVPPGRRAPGPPARSSAPPSSSRTSPPSSSTSGDAYGGVSRRDAAVGAYRRALEAMRTTDDPQARGRTAVVERKLKALTSPVADR